jgi:hypothetical protein
MTIQEEIKPAPYQREAAVLRRELESLMNERQSLLKVTGAAAGLIVGLDPEQVPVNMGESINQIAGFLNNLAEETLQDALIAVHSHTKGPAT